MRFGKIISGVLAAMLFGVPTTSIAAQNLECISDGYDAAHGREVDAYQNGFRADNGWAPELPGSITVAVSGRAGDCAEQHDWSPEAIEDAIYFRLFTIMHEGMIRNAPFSQAQMQRIDRTIASADQERLRAVVSQIMTSMFGGDEAPEISDADTMFFGRLVLRSGVPATETNGVFVGAYIGATVMPRLIADRFATR